MLPHLWFRNTWAWAEATVRPALRAAGPDRVAVDHPRLGCLVWEVDTDPNGALPDLLFCENETNVRRLFDSAQCPPFPKDGINDHVLTGAPTVNPDGAGTKTAAWYRLAVAPGETQVVRVRLRPPSSTAPFGVGRSTRSS